MENPENGHCWHTIVDRYVLTSAEYEKCCYCGTMWHEGMRTIPHGHGKFAPQTLPVPKPTSSCPGRR